MKIKQESEVSNDVIKHCFDEHVKDSDGDVKFNLEEYKRFWESHKTGNIYNMSNRDGSVVKCSVVYYPLPEFKDLRALIEISNSGKGTDLREVPVHYLEIGSH